MESAADGSLVLIAPGVYEERVSLSRPVTLKADGGEVTLRWHTDAPYEAALESTAMARWRVHAIVMDVVGRD